MDVLDNRCPSCGAKIFFDPVSQTWSCEYCGAKFTLDEMKKYTNASSDKANSDAPIKTMDVDMYTCKNCGAKIVADDETTSTFCVYCGSTAILKDKLSGELRPTLIIPFKKTKDDAISAFKKLYKGRPFMPKFFNKQENIEKLTGIYIPFWVYDCLSSGEATFNCTDVRSWSDSTYRYTETKTYSVIKNGETKFEKIPVDGSTRFEDDLMDSIEPFNYSDLVEYNHAYLSGFFAEKYDLDSVSAQERAKTRAEKSLIDCMSSSIINHKTKTLMKSDIKTDFNKSEYILLPVWMVNIKFNNKMHTFAMNGQTGKIVGNIPLDKKKAVLWFIMIFIIIFIIELVITKVV